MLWLHQVSALDRSADIKNEHSDDRFAVGSTPIYAQQVLEHISLADAYRHSYSGSRLGAVRLDLTP